MAARRPLCILSVGRSGTSLVARALETLGVDFGPRGSMLAPSDWNPQGYWEQQAVMELNDEILAALGGGLWDPPSPLSGWERAADMRGFVARARELVAATFRTGGPWGFKDPRTVLTLPLWLKAVGPMDYVICIRSPLEVIASLRVGRPDLPDERLFALWLRSNCEALRVTAGERRLILAYESWFDDARATASKLAAFAFDGRTVDDATWESLREHFEPSLRRQRMDGAPLVSRLDVPVEVRALDVLMRRLADGSDPALEALAASLDGAFEQRLRGEGEREASRRAAEEAAATACAREERARVERVRLERRLGMIEETAERLEAALAAERERTADRERSLAAITGSATWRLTAPARALRHGRRRDAVQAARALLGASPDGRSPEAVAVAPAPSGPPASVSLPVDVPAEIAADERRRLLARAAELGPWVQGPFPIGGGDTVGGPWRCDERWATLEPLLGDVSGARALDVGANAGWDAFMLRLRGCREVMAVEPHHFAEQALFLEELYGSGVDIRRIGWQALRAESHGLFDLVHCGGLLLHEPQPLALLRRLREMTADGGLLVVGTMVAPAEVALGKVRFVREAVDGDDTWLWVPDRLALADMLAVAGFDVEGEAAFGPGRTSPFPCSYRYVAARAARPPASAITFAPPSDEVPTRFPIGHYYSPAPDPRELVEEPRHSQVWPATPRETVGVDWRDAEQVRLCRGVLAAQERLVLADHETGDETEYFADNDQYPALDAWILEAMLRHRRPRRMIEIGSGFSTLVTARVNREYLASAMRVTCIEPYPRGFLLAGVPGIDDLRVEKIQDTPLTLFDELGAGDVLFIDTSHTVKTGNDVTWLFGEVLPRLASGVAVHVHDIFLPGDYPEQWVMEGWGWNENYLVRAFLAYNDAFEVLLGAQYMLHRHPDVLAEAFPGLAAQARRGGASLWLQRR